MKRKGKFRQQSSLFTKKRNTVDETPDESVDQNDEEFFYDEIDKFHSQKEKLLLKNEDVQSDDDFESGEEEVLGIESDDTEDSHDDDDSEEVDPDDGLPSNSAWGKKKSTFYGADSLEGLEGSDKEEAEQEEEREVLAMQERLTREIDEEDIGLELLQIAGQIKGTEEAPKFHVQADFSKLSVKAQWRLVRKESPELPELIKDFKEKLSELKDKLSPLMIMVKRGEIESEDLGEYVKLKYTAYLSYLLNISFYLALRANKTTVENHPVIERLVQYRRIINQLTPIDDKLKLELEQLHTGLSRSEDDSTADETNDENRRLKIANNLKQKRPEDFKIAEDFYNTMSEQLLLNNNPDELNEVSKTVNTEEKERRAINYEMAKNKGLAQKKKKIDRNPRVKLKHKYKKAKISRRGQVREYKPEIKKYSGEASGIRIGLRKSVTLQ